MWRAKLGLLLCAIFAAVPGRAARPVAAGDSSYRGWHTVCLSNAFVQVHLVPEIAGRIIQFKLGAKEFLWVNPKLAGRQPTASGLAPDGGWLNYGGDKLWPAPQGWDGDQQWPGPPDAVLDGQPHRLEKLRGGKASAAVRLTSRPDPRSGIQFARVIRIFPQSTRVSFEATMKNIDNKPRRWGIWAHTQLDAGRADATGYNPLMKAWCPLNPGSHFPQGYSVIFGERENPSFQVDANRSLLSVQYRYRVGKVGVDSAAGWTATVDGTSGDVFVQRFTFEPGREYPDGSSVEFWHNGVGKIHAYNKEMVMEENPAENPYVFESELLSPFASLRPGQKYTWRYDWYACNIGGDFRVVTCSDAGVVAEPLAARSFAGALKLRGRFGVFTSGKLEAVLLDARGKRISREAVPGAVTPLAPVLVETTIDLPRGATEIELRLVGNDGQEVGMLTRTAIGQ